MRKMFLAMALALGLLPVGAALTSTTAQAAQPGLTDGATVQLAAWHHHHRHWHHHRHY